MGAQPCSGYPKATQTCCCGVCGAAKPHGQSPVPGEKDLSGNEKYVAALLGVQRVTRTAGATCKSTASESDRMSWRRN